MHNAAIRASCTAAPVIFASESRRLMAGQYIGPSLIVTSEGDSSHASIWSMASPVVLGGS
jgi:hypothetical protein